MAERFEPAQHTLVATPRLAVALIFFYLGLGYVVGVQPLRLSRDLATLSDADLCEWSVLNGSALATSFAALVAHAAPARQAALVADPWWLVAPTVDASFVHVRSRARNDRPGCPAGSTVKYLVTFPSVAAGAFRDTPGMCGQVQAVSPKGRNPAVMFNVGMVFTDAGHNGALPDAAAAARLRRIVTELNRRLRLELRDPTVLRQGPAALEAVCPTAVNWVGTKHLVAPVGLLLGLILGRFVLLAVGVPRLLAAATVAEGPADGEGAAPDGEGGVTDGEGGAPDQRGVSNGDAVAPPALSPPPPPRAAPTGLAGRGGGDAVPADAGRGGTARWRFHVW